MNLKIESLRVMKRISRLLSISFLVLAVLPWPSFAAEPLSVVASFSILGDLVRTVGGEQVRVTTLVGADGDAHVYQPTPSDAKAMAKARLVIVNGLGFEGWLERLIKASGFTGQVVVASSGVNIRAMTIAHEEHHEQEGHHHGPVDPHAWQDLRNGMIYVQNIVAALAEADPTHALNYRHRAEDYLAQLKALDQEIHQRLATLPPERRKILTSHDAFGYFAEAYGLTILAPVGISTDAEASAADVAALIRQVRSSKVKAIFVENITDPRLIERIAAETGARVGGALYSDALSGSQGLATTYLAMFRNNLRVLLAVLATSGGSGLNH
ncbi:zinc/manganese transport system substrate-binding protein [Gammaproteobacteria bacterium]